MLDCLYNVANYLEQTLINPGLPLLCLGSGTFLAAIEVMQLEQNSNRHSEQVFWKIKRLLNHKIRVKRFKVCCISPRKWEKINYLSCKKSEFGITYITAHSHICYVTSCLVLNSSPLITKIWKIHFYLSQLMIIFTFKLGVQNHLFRTNRWFWSEKGLAPEVLEALLSARPPHSPPFPIKYPNGLAKPGKWFRIFFTIY